MILLLLEEGSVELACQMKEYILRHLYIGWLFH